MKEIIMVYFIGLSNMNSLCIPIHLSLCYHQPTILPKP